MKRIFQIALIIIIYLGIIFTSTKVYATSGVTTSETTRIREEASTSSETLALVSIYTEVEIVGEEGEWYKVTYSGYTGYIRKDMLSVEGDENETSTQNEATTETTNSIISTDNTTTNSEQEKTEEQNSVANEVSSVTAVTSNEIETGYIGNLASSIEVRIVPSINSSIIATISENTEFTVIEVINKWCYIETEANYGWVLISKINTTEATTDEQQETTEVAAEENNTTTEETTETNTTTNSTTNTSEANTTETTTKYVSTETLNLRQTADNNATILKQLSLNDKVTVIEVVDSTWTKITYNGTTGYVASKYLSDTTTATTSRSESLAREVSESSDTTNLEEATDTAVESSASTQSSTAGSDIVAYAKQYLGYKYVSGGTSPETGFDCSGFTYYVYKHFGVTISRTSTAQASNGVEVSKANLQEGDLVIFNNSSNSGIGHVGIYIGGNSFIHAANSSKGVITTSLSSSYYAARYVTARRIIN